MILGAKMRGDCLGTNLKSCESILDLCESWAHFGENVGESSIDFLKSYGYFGKKRRELRESCYKKRRESSADSHKTFDNLRLNLFYLFQNSFCPFALTKMRLQRPIYGRNSIFSQDFIAFAKMSAPHESTRQRRWVRCF